jgi:hypothetical protein
MRLSEVKNGKRRAEIERVALISKAVISVSRQQHPTT